MNRKIMTLAAIAAGTFALAACDNFQMPDEGKTVEIEIGTEAEPAPSAEDSAAPVVAPEVTDPVPTAPVDRLPPEERNSSETVKPESETLFY